MRTAFVQTLRELATANERILWLVGDLGYSVAEPFAQEFPDRFVNVGVAEQNMTSIATGLALCGKVVFIYSTGNFPTLRCLEQIRNDICYHNANVKIVAVGGGFAYGALGQTHHATEDIAIMRALPNMTVVVPGDPVEAELATRAIAQLDGPCYLRLGRAGEPTVHQATPHFRIGRAIMIQDGRDVTFITTGGMLYVTVQAAETLSGQGIQARVLSMHTIKPMDSTAILAAKHDTGTFITIEEHNVVGGLGSAVAEVLAESGNLPITFKRLGIEDTFCSHVGNQEYLREAYSLSARDIVTVAKSLLGRSAITGK